MRPIHLTAKGIETACGLHSFNLRTNWAEIARTYSRSKVTCKRCKAAMRSARCRDWGHY